MDKSVYSGSSVVLTTKHGKSSAIAPVFLEILGASVVEYNADTDKLGTFSGEIDRKENALECARKKCEWAFNTFGNKFDFALASEGSFGPHPFIPFFPCDNEILYFIDRQRVFHLHLSHLSEKTNYRVGSVSSIEELYKFAKSVQFPSHGLILRPHGIPVKELIFKGINSLEILEVSFKECIKYSPDKKVWVETDMRADFNPSRMKVIGELALRLAQQLKVHCPKCHTPGWGKVREERGLICSSCGTETELVKSEIFSCVKCSYNESANRSDGLEKADPGSCHYCNP